MVKFKYCAACLVTDVKMYSLSERLTSNPSSTLGDIYSQLLQIPEFDKTQHVCFECARLIYKFQEFKSKCCKAQSLMSLVAGADDSEIKNVVFQNIDRDLYKLSSRFSISSVKIVDTLSDDIESDNKTIDVNPKLEIELKNKIIKNEATTVKINSREPYQENINKHNTNTADILNEYDEPVETLYSDDSHNSDTIVSTKGNKPRKAKKEPKARKRKIKTNTAHIDFCDDEPLSKVSKSLNKNENNDEKNKYPRNFKLSDFQDYATVLFLTPEDAKMELLLRKESANYKISQYKCELCYKGYEAKTAYENHMKRHSVKYGEYECDLCHLRFPEQKFLSKHRLACHKRKFLCKLCSYVCNCTHQAKNHMSMHKGKKYPCNECAEVFSMPNSLLMHKRLKHVTECVCELCGSTFATPRGLYSHNTKLHRQDVNSKRGPKCEDCGIHFSTEMAWKKHLVLSSKHNVSNGCKHCGETFTNAEELKTHSKIHARKQSSRLEQVKLPAACGICDKWLSDRNEYKSHMTSQHPETDVAQKLHLANQIPFVCEICGRMFKSGCVLRYHQRAHSGERPHACAECGGTFARPSALAAHRARAHPPPPTPPPTHAPPTPRPACRLCARSFTHRSGLNKHMKAHLNIRPHKCTICDKGFINPCDRKVHIKYVHNKVPWPKKDRSKRKNVEKAAQFT